VLAVALSLAAGSAGALGALRRVLTLRPAEAMRPASPPAFGHMLLGRRWRPAVKMALRGIAGRPLRTLFSILGLAMAVPMIVLGLFWWDALRFMIAVQFEGVDRADAVVSFTDRSRAGPPGRSRRSRACWRWRDSGSSPSGYAPGPLNTGSD
jgi:putative ABC transport system permease protein